MWDRRVELTVRAYVRQASDTKLIFDEIIEKIKRTIFGRKGTVDFGEFRDIYWPILPEDVQKFNDKGYFTVRKHKDCILIRELPITVRHYLDDSHNFGEDIITTLTSVCGEIFSTIKIVEEKITGIQAI